MIGGIYLEIPFGKIYNDKKRYAIHKELWTLLGIKDKFFDKKTFDEMIYRMLRRIVAKNVRRIGETQSPVSGSVRGYFNRSVDLMRSTCAGIYNNGQLIKPIYRFNGGKSELKEAKDVTGDGRVRNHNPGPAARAERFLSEYECLNKSGWCVVIASTMPYAVSLEKGSNGKVSFLNKYSVLINAIPKISRQIFAARPKSVNLSATYGYIFERGGRENIQNITY